MLYYMGIDVSLESSHVCVVDEGGVVVKEAKELSGGPILSPDDKVPPPGRMDQVRPKVRRQLSSDDCAVLESARFFRTIIM